MVLDSYNEKYNLVNEENKGKYQTYVGLMTGYQISWDYGINWDSWTNDSINYLSKEDSLYVTNTTKGVKYWWLASPCAYDTGMINLLRYDGRLTYDPPAGTLNGFRPLVCLKSDTQLIENADGTYTIK